MTGRFFLSDRPFRPKRRSGLLLLCAVLGLALVLPLRGLSLAREPYRIGYLPNAQISLESKNRLEAVYARAGLPVEFVPLPQKRSLYLAAAGDLDGDAGRIYGLESNYPSMIRVEGKLLNFNGAAYVIKGQHIGEYRDSLLDVMKVGSLCGVVWVEKVMKGRCLEQVNTYEGLFAMLLEGRIDLVLSSQRSAETVFRKAPHFYESIERLEPLVFQTTFYHYLNEKNADIVPKLEKALKELRDENYWDDEAQ
ncbi:polar amino acid transport system substrate-binding protein [Pseudodesulfovibrio indicus]|uniref:Polar amino acid transport system substrate-binding protein n=1 Tax=Pseudodesulfovibrio indicus TaxID=1716143 RepID=A0AA94THZ3_9BACT|nr:polar amino acid transport system substrate-binding protein [Pseudodesulfovibrio indicus]